MASRTRAASATPPSLNRPGTKQTSPAFSDPTPTPDPKTFVVKHPSDQPLYDEIDAFNKAHGVHALPFPAPRGGLEPLLVLQAILGSDTAIAAIQANKQIVFHALGDCGSTAGPATQNLVVDKMLADFKESNEMEVPQFHLLLGDVVYSFGEVKYYYDQFYDPYRDYPAPILAAAGNHDGMIAPEVPAATTLEGFLRNFCADPATGYVVMPEAGMLSRTAQIQPGVFFTFEAPFVTILVLYSNALEDPGVISNADVGTTQLGYLRAALMRLKKAQYSGALLFAHHHPPYTLAKHGWSIDMQTQIDQICEEVGLWPHADLAGHAHNYQRFTRTRPDGTEIPYIVCGNGGHGIQRLSTTSGTVLRAPQLIQAASTDASVASPLRDQVVFESYDDGDYGYLRVIVTARQLRVEYHPASDGAAAKVPDDSVTVDLATRRLASYIAPALDRMAAAKDAARVAAKAKGGGRPAPPGGGPKAAKQGAKTTPSRKKV